MKFLGKQSQLKPARLYLHTYRTLGCLPALKPYAKYLPDPFFRQGVEAVQNLAGIAVARVKDRLDNPEQSHRVDLLARLMEGKDSNGNKLGREELTAEALTQLVRHLSHLAVTYETDMFKDCWI